MTETTGEGKLTKTTGTYTEGGNNGQRVAKQSLPSCLWSSKQALLFRVASPNVLKSYAHQTPVASPLRAQGKGLTTALITYCNTSPLLPLGNLRVGITSTHLGSYFIQAAIISHFKERKRVLSYFRKHVMWDDHMATNVSRFKKLYHQFN